uniref:RING-type domain-containing protein n=1 Tax=Kalanchoe fedtschenkoi TaxID=63787 RepID=A0A7N0V8M9_KALFE
MASVCPFAKALGPDDASKKHSKNQSKSETNSEDKGKTCPFAKFHKPHDSSTKCPGATSWTVVVGSPTSSPSKSKPYLIERSGPHKLLSEYKAEGESGNSAVIPAKCPYGFDSQTFKIGPFSCVICQAILFKSSRCVPCSHVFCYACVSRFKDCPLCGADIRRIEDDANLQAFVLDVAVSLAKVADVDRSLGNEDTATEGFEEGIKLLESLILSSDDPFQEQRRTSVMDFVKSQLAEKQPAVTRVKVSSHLNDGSLAT